MEALSHRQMMILVEKWDDENPDDLEWYRKNYADSLIQWLYKKGYRLIFEGVRYPTKWCKPGR